MNTVQKVDFTVNLFQIIHFWIVFSILAISHFGYLLRQNWQPQQSHQGTKSNLTITGFIKQKILLTWLKSKSYYKSNWHKIQTKLDSNRMWQLDCKSVIPDMNKMPTTRDKRFKKVDLRGNSLNLIFVLSRTFLWELT